MSHQHHQQQAAAALAVLNQPTHIVAKNVVVNFAKNHYITTALYILGLFCIVFGTGLAVSPANVERYDEIMSRVDTKESIEVLRETQSLRNQYYNAKGFFSCDATCTAIKKRLDVLEEKLAQVNKKNSVIVSQAKAEVGVFSEYGVQEARDYFWSTFAKGKQFAKNASWWDMIFLGLGSMGRDEGLAEFIIRLVMRVIMNLTLGLIGALVAFWWGVWGIIASYQPSWFGMITAFFLFCIAGASLVASILLSIYGVLACGVHAAVRQAQIAGVEFGGPGAQARPQPIGFGGRGGAGGYYQQQQQQPQQQQYSETSSSSEEIRPGSRVRIFGLNATQYNGQTGFIFSRSEDRFQVRLDDGRELAVKATNLVLA